MGITNLNSKSKMKVSTLTTILVLCLVSARLAESIRNLYQDGRTVCDHLADGMTIGYTNVNEKPNRIGHYWFCKEIRGEMFGELRECTGHRIHAGNITNGRDEICVEPHESNNWADYLAEICRRSHFNKMKIFTEPWTGSCTAFIYCKKTDIDSYSGELRDCNDSHAPGTSLYNYKRNENERDGNGHNTSECVLRSQTNTICKDGIWNIPTEDKDLKRPLLAPDATQ